MLWKSQRHAISVLVGAVLLIAGCAPVAPPPGVPKADLIVPPVGSTWVIADKNTGSYGSASGRLTIRRLDDQMWQGRKVRAYSDGAVILYVDAETAGWVARVRETTKAPVESYDPPLGFDWPLWVGKSWVRTYRYTDHERGRTFDGVQTWYKVEAYEDVTIPVGTLKAFRVSWDSGGFVFGVFWWNAELGLTIKSRSERTIRSYLGPGTRETDLVSYDIKR